MDFSFTDEQQEIRDLSRRILGDHATLERLKEVEASDDGFDRGAWADLATANLLGIALPESTGGSGFGFLEACLVLQEVGRAVLAVPYLATVVTGAMPIARFGTADQQQRFLPGVIAGDTILTAALAELHAPSESPTTTARAVGDGWRLDGVKTNVPYAEAAAAVLVPARTDDGEVGVFIVEPTSPGVRLDRQITMNHEPQFRMELDGAQVAAGDRLGGPEVLEWILDRATVGVCAVVAGVTDAALKLTAEYTTTRKQFDRAIGTFQAVGQRMADAYIDNEAVHLTMLQAATRLADEETVPEEVLVAKFWAADGGHRVVHAALHVHGGISIDVDYPVHRYFLWAKQAEFTLGSATPELAKLGRILAAEPA
jgi:alkylation response protein AidB-like acyl-CoA dehydrogenase